MSSGLRPEVEKEYIHWFPSRTSTLPFFLCGGGEKCQFLYEALGEKKAGGAEKRRRKKELNPICHACRLRLYFAAYYCIYISLLGRQFTAFDGILSPLQRKQSFFFLPLPFIICVAVKVSNVLEMCTHSVRRETPEMLWARRGGTSSTVDTQHGLYASLDYLYLKSKSLFSDQSPIVCFLLFAFVSFLSSLTSCRWKDGNNSKPLTFKQDWCFQFLLNFFLVRHIQEGFGQRKY